MPQFDLNKEACTQCGLCVADCPARVIAAQDGYPYVAAEKESSCYRCQHCLAVCPTGAVAVLGLQPQNSQPLNGNLPAPEDMELLLKGRRAVRRYKEENLEPEVIQRLLEVASYAPSGMNTRQVRFTVVEDRQKLVELRDEMMAGLCRLRQEGVFQGGLEFFAEFVRRWEEEQVDFLFRGAPHLLVVSAPQAVPTPVEDCMIALSYFEIFANSNGIGTLWDGLAKLAINDFLPQFRTRLGIPEDHLVGYAMVFGRPAVGYARTTQHAPAEIHRVS